MTGPGRALRARLGLAAAGAVLLGAPLLAQSADPFELRPEFLTQASFSCGNVTLNGNARVDSAGVANAGHVVSNGDVTLNGKAVVAGDATAGPGKTVRVNGSAKVTGTRGNLTVAWPCSPVDLSALAAALSISNDNARVPRTAKGKDPLTGPGRTDLVLNGNDTLALPAGTYYLTSITVNGGSKVTLAGEARLLCTGAVTVNGSSSVNAPGSPFALRLFTSGAAVTVNGGSSLGAFVYASRPTAAVTVNGGAALTGGLYGGALVVDGSSRLTRHVDTSAPLVVSVTESGQPLPDGAVFARAITPVVATSGGTAPVTVTATLDGTAYEPGTLIAAEGTHVLSVTATDSSASPRQASLARSFTIDTGPPALVVTAPQPAALLGASPVAVTGNAGDASSLTVAGAAVPLGEGGSFTALVPLHEGTNRVALVARDAAGNEARLSLPVVLDSLPPVVVLEIPSSGACLGPDAPLALSGRVADAHPAGVTRLVLQPAAGAPVVLDLPLDAAGRFAGSFPSLSPGDGGATLLASAVDALGHEGRALVALRVDGTAPEVSLTLDGSPFPGSGPGEAPPAGASPAWVNRAVAARVLASDGSAAPPTTSLTLDGSPWVEGTPISTEGTHLLVARARDCAGNETAAHASFAVDTTPPSLVATVPADGALSPAPVATYSGLASADVTAAKVNGAEAAVTPQDGSAAFTLSPFPWREGENRVAIELVDRAGNRASFERTFRVKTSGPTVEILSGGLPIPAGAVFFGPVTPEVVTSEPLSGPDAAALIATLDGTPYVPGTAVTAAGAHTLSATVRDVAGHEASATAGFTIDLSEGPFVTISSPADGATVPGTTVDVSGTVSAAHPSGPTAVTVNGRAASVAGSAWTLAALPLVPDAPNEIVATAVDALGRSASRTIQVLVSSAPPQVLILSPADGARTNRRKTDVVGAVVGGARATADGTVRLGALTVAIDAAGSFRFLDVPLADGANTLTVTALDAQGRTGERSVTVSLDATPPTVSFAVAGQPLADGATFDGPVTVTVLVADSGGPVPPPRLLLNGSEVAASSASTEVAVGEAGGFVLAVVAADGAGNETRASRTFVVGGAACGLSDVRPADGSATPDDRVTITGRSGGARRVLVRVPQPGGGSLDYEASLADGTFAAGEVPLPSTGENALALVCEGETGAPTTTPLRITRLGDGGPEVTITGPAPGALVSDARVTVTGTVSDAAADLFVNGVKVEAAARSGSAFTQPGVALAEGPNVLSVRAVDRAGRAGEARVVVRRDSQAPRLTVTWPTSGARVGAPPGTPPTLDVSGQVDLASEPNLSSVVASTPAGSAVATVDPQTGTFRAAGLPLGSGTVRVHVVATDSLGHSAAVDVDVEGNAAGPALAVAAPPDAALLDATSPSSIPVAGEAWATEGATVSVNGGALDPATLAWDPAGADGRRHVSFSTAVAVPPQDGPVGIVLRADDREGRSAAARRLLVRDATPPSVVEVFPAAGAAGVDPNALVLVLFSEPVAPSSLAGPEGLTVRRDGQAEALVGSITRAGSAVAFVPGAALLPGGTYRVRVGTGVRDLAGNPLAATRESAFTVSAGVAGTAPLLDPPLPSVVCESALEVRGTAAPGATLRVTDGTIGVSGVADASGRFSISLPLVGNGFHDVVVRVVGRDGTLGPATHALVRRDCSAPSVERASLDRAAGRVAVLFSERMSAASLALSASPGDGASLVLSLEDDPQATPRPGTLSIDPDGATVTIHLPADADAWWRDVPVRLTVRPPAADERGNAIEAAFVTTFFPGAGPGDLTGGFVSGEAYDDATGRPLPGVEVRLQPSGAALPGSAPAPDTPTALASTDVRGRYGFFGDVTAGRYAVHLGKPGYTSVVRRLPLSPGTGAVPFDARLTPLANASTAPLDPASGGAFTGQGLVLDAAPNPFEPAIAGPLDVRLTPLSGQGLPELLPLGWSVLSAADVRLESAGAPVPQSAAFGAGSVHLTLPLPAATAPGAPLVAVRHDLVSGLWLTLGPLDRRVEGDGTETARVALVSSGAVAILLADEGEGIRPPVPEGEGTPLGGAVAPSPVPALEATLSLDPPVVSPTGRSTARVVARSADGTTAWPSGLAVQAYLDEKLVLSGGGELYEAPFTADLVLAHAPLTPAELGSSPPATAGALTFNVSPSPKAAQVLLEQGFENVRLYPFPETLERGSVLGAFGGTVTSSDGAELTLPEGALAESVAVGARLLSDEERSQVTVPAGYSLVAAVRVDLSGRTLARAATLSVPAPAGSPADPVGEARLVLAEVVALPEDGRGSFARLTARAERQAASSGSASVRLVAAPEASGTPLPLEGLVREGTYLFLRAEAPLGFATGFVRIGNGNGLPGSRVAVAPTTVPFLGTADLSRPGGRYAIPVPAGADRDVVALHPALDERGTGRIPGLAPGAVASLDLTVRPVGPHVVSVQPADGATEQPVGTPILVRFSEPIVPASVVPGVLTAELLGPDGTPTGAFFTGSLSLQADGATLVLAPSHPLPAGRRVRATLASGIRDVGGTPCDGPVPYAWSFTTSAQVATGGLIDPRKIRLLLPENGTARVVGDPGAVPAVPAGQTPWSVTAEVENGPATPLCPVTTVPVDSTGGFAATAGCPPQVHVTTASRVFVKVIDPQGNVTLLELGPFTTPDGKGFVAPAGKETVFTTTESVEVTVPALAFDGPTLVRIAKKDPATLGVPVPEGMQLGAFLDVDFEGTAKETLRVRVPVETTAPEGTLVVVGEPLALPWGQRLRMLDAGSIVAQDGRKLISTAWEDQPGDPDLPAGAAPSAREGAAPTDLPRASIRTALAELTAKAFAAFLFSTGADLSLATGTTTPSDVLTQVGVLYLELADTFVYLPPPTNWDGGYLLPVVAGTPFTLVARDRSTGWIISRNELGTLPSVPNGLVQAPEIQDNDPGRPALVEAGPFQLLRFRAETPGESDLCHALSLELQACTATNGTPYVKVEKELPKGSRLWLLHLATGTQASGSPKKDPAQGFRLEGTAPGDADREFVAVVTPGDLVPDGWTSFRLAFDRPLKKLEDAEVTSAVELFDCGEAATKCEPSVPVDVEAKLDAPRTAVTVSLRAALPRGHLFRLKLNREVLRGGAIPGTEVEPMYRGPDAFLFGTRAAPAAPTQQSGDLSLGDTDVARDLLKIGNLLFVASGTGRLLALDVSRATKVESSQTAFQRHAMLDESALEVRALAADGHNRLHYNVRAGGTWGIRTVRVEDVRQPKPRGGGDCKVPVPAWAATLPCFPPVEGAVRTALATGSGTNLLGSEYVSLVGGLATGTPSALEVLVEDGNPDAEGSLDFEEFYGRHRPDPESNPDPGGAASPSFEALPFDEKGFATFDVLLRTKKPGKWDFVPRRPSLSPCPGEDDWDRYQRVTVDNLTTGQSWSFDVENTSAEGGSLVAEKLRARRGDRLRVRYNIRAYGYVAIVGSGISVVDLNRYYRVPPTTTGLDTRDECGRRLGRFEGEGLEFPSCSPPLEEDPVTHQTYQPGPVTPDGIRYTPAVAPVGRTGGAGTGTSGRGGSAIHVLSPLMHYGGLLSSTPLDRPGCFVATDECKPPAEAAPACFRRIASGGAKAPRVWLRSVAVGTEVTWLDRGDEYLLDGTVKPEFGTPHVVKPKTGDLAFFSLGPAGVAVFDVGSGNETSRTLGRFIGRFRVPGHEVYRLQVDVPNRRLFAGGWDTTKTPSEPVIDVFDVSRANGMPAQSLTGEDLREDRLLFTVRAPWETNHVGVAEDGTGLLFTWGTGGAGGARPGGSVVPLSDPVFSFVGLYRPEGDPQLQPGVAGSIPSERPTSTFVPLGVPTYFSAVDEENEAKKKESERRVTAAFRVRVALPGDLGESLVAKVQTLRALPDTSALHQEDLGGAVGLPGGPGWPATEVFVTLRRLGTQEVSGAAGSEGQYAGETGKLSAVYNHYESKEVVLLLADPRARKDYTRQKLDTTDPQGQNVEEEADEESQCRRCDRPSYLDRLIQDGKLAAGDVKELLAAGPWVRALLSVTPFYSDAPPPADNAAERTGKVIRTFGWDQPNGDGYRAPRGTAGLLAWADEVPGPVQAALREPVEGAAFWDSGERGAGVHLTSGELDLGTTDYAKAGRGMDVAFRRSYRSGVLGYGPLGSAGFGANLFAHLRRIPLLGEAVRPRGTTGPPQIDELQKVPDLVEIHDGTGRVVRAIAPAEGHDCPPGYERGEEESYCVPKGFPAMLQMLEGGKRWRLVGRHSDAHVFDARGRLLEIRDRHRKAAKDPYVRGNTHLLTYDGFGQLTGIEDDYRRSYRLGYRERKDSERSRYGLLESFESFAGRKVKYEFDEDRRLTVVQLPQVTNSEISGFDLQEPRIEYGYTTTVLEPTAPAHGPDFSKLRLADVKWPSREKERLAFKWSAASGRISALDVPGPEGMPRVAWTFHLEPDTALPPASLQLVAPWGHARKIELDKGRVRKTTERLPVLKRDAPTPESPADFQPEDVDVITEYDWEVDGRLKTVKTAPEGRTTTYEYVSRGTRLDRANVKSVTETGGDLTRTRTYDYGLDRLRSQVTDDGAGNAIELPVANASGSSEASGPTSTLAFRKNGQDSPEASEAFLYDAYARETEARGGADGGISADKTAYKYGEDARKTAEAGPLKTLETGNVRTELGWDQKAWNLTSIKQKTAETTLDYDEWDRVIRERDAAGGDVRRAYDGAGRLRVTLVKQEGLDGDAETRVEYDDADRPKRLKRTKLASEEGKPTAEGETKWTYDEWGRLTELESPGGVKTKYEYDVGGRVKTVTVGPRVERRFYDEGGRLTLVTDGHEGAVRILHDALGDPYEETHPTGAVVEREFGGDGRLTKETVKDANGTLFSETAFEWTSFGALAKETSTLGAAPSSGGETPVRTVETKYDKSGRVERVILNETMTTTVEYDGSSRPWKRTDAYGNTEEVTYFDGTAWPHEITVTEKDGGTAVTTYERDAAGRPTGETWKAGPVEKYTDRKYDELGNLRAVTPEGMASTKYTWDAEGKLLTRTSPAGAVETSGWDLDGRVKLRRAEGEAGASWDTRFQYDTSQGGRLTRVTHPDGTVTEFTTWDPDGAVRTWVDRYGHTITHTVDAANRVKGTTVTGGPSEAGVYGLTTEWDVLSRVTSIEKTGDPASRVARTYDLGGRPTTVEIGTGVTETRKYDSFDALTENELAGDRVGHSGRLTVENYYNDALHRLTVSTASESGELLTQAGLTWWGIGLKAAGTAGGLVQRYEYDAPGLLTKVSLGSEEESLGSLDLTYEAASGYRTGRTTAGRLFSQLGWLHTPDGAFRPLTARAGSFESFRFGFGKRDELELMVRTVAAREEKQDFGVAGRLTARGGVTWTYDAAGNRTEDDRATYRWSWRNELLEVKPKDGPWRNHTVEYEWDAEGTLTSRTVKDGDGSFVEKRLFHFVDGVLLTEEAVDASGAARWRRRFASGPAGLDDAVQFLLQDYGSGSTPRNESYALLRDEQGMPVALTEDTPGTPPAGPPLVARFLYTPFGEAHVELGPELLKARYEPTLRELDGVTQAPPAPAPNETLPGGVTFMTTLPFLRETLATGLVVESWSAAEGRFVPAPREDFVVAADPSEPEKLGVMRRDAWPKASRWRIVLTQVLTDDWSRPFQPPAVPAAPGVPAGSAVPTDRFEALIDVPDDGVTLPFYDRTFPLEYDNVRAAGETLDGRIPSGLNVLHQGSWTDPVTGLAFKRARWYDTRTGTWLSEDPAGTVDSPSLYAFVGNRPNLATDPTGTCVFGAPCPDWLKRSAASLGGFLYQGMAEGLQSTPPGQALGVANAATRAGIKYREAFDRGGAAALGDAVWADTVDTAVGLLPGVGSYREGRKALSDCEGNAFECGRQVFRATRAVGTDITIAYGAAKGLQTYSRTQSAWPSIVPEGGWAFAAKESAVPSQLAAGQAFEAEQLSTLGLDKNTLVMRPSVKEMESAAFRVIVGEGRFTKGGIPKGTIFDATDGALLEIKGGTSPLGSTYQLRLQTYFAVKTETPFTIRTTRPIAPSFGDWLTRWGVKVEAP